MRIKYIYLKLLYIIVNKICNSFRLTPGSGEHNFVVRQMSKNNINYYLYRILYYYNGRIGRSRRDFYCPLPTRVQRRYVFLHNRYTTEDIIIMRWLYGDFSLQTIVNLMRKWNSFALSGAIKLEGRIIVLVG